MSHPIDSFYAAVSVLAGHGDIKQRLISAYEQNLNDIEDDQLPIPMKQPFADLKHLLHRVTPANGEGPVCATVRKMSVPEADRCAQLMVDLLQAGLKYGETGQAALPLVVQDSIEPVPQVPPFLVKSG